MNDTGNTVLMKMAQDYKNGVLDHRTLTREVWSRVKVLAEGMKAQKVEEPTVGHMRNGMRRGFLRKARMI